MTEATDIHGAIVHAHSGRKDSLVRVSLKAVILDDKGYVLVVKERGRDWWDIPGGGLEHGESIKEALTRELHEEVALKANFEFETILAEDPHYQKSNNLYQMRITFLVKPEDLDVGVGEDSDEVQFVDPNTFEYSELITERKIFEYSQLAKTRF